MHFHLILTERCNSKCVYCYEKSMREENNLRDKFKFDFSASSDSEVNLKILKSFIAKDTDKDTWIEFYGGEPLLQIEKMRNIMNAIPQVKYAIQTNGKLLHLLSKTELDHIEKILVSIDGKKERTDENRGAGSYDLIIKNIKNLRKNGYTKEIVARMTISFPDIEKQVKHLSTLVDRNLFSSIHWQLDAGFYAHDFNKNNFEKFIVQYNQEISSLIQYWIKEIKKGKVYKMYPFIAITQSLLNNEQTRLRCGSGYANYTITTTGKLSPCPIMTYMTDFYVGTINESSPNKLQQIFVNEPCSSCTYLDLCGGRCLYANIVRLWPREGQNLICETSKHLIDELKIALPTINNLISKKVIQPEDFEYEKYFGPEIIP